MKTRNAIILATIAIAVAFLFVKVGMVIKSDNPVKSVWIESYQGREKDGKRINVRFGTYLNDLKKINGNQYLFLGKDECGITFDSTIITINK